MDIPNFIRFTLRDALGRKEYSGETDIYIQAGAKWLTEAYLAAGDGGVAAQYSFVTGWDFSYIETTGYILITFFSLSRYFRKKLYFTQAVKMADFLLKNQLPCGAFQSGTPKTKKIIPRVFNTGEVIKGLVVAFRETKDKKYLLGAAKAADWLCACQALDGEWKAYEYMDRGHAYHARTSHSLLMVWQETKQKKYLISAKKNLKWVCDRQRKNGWFESCEFQYPQYPFTHAISYTIEGLLECFYIILKKKYWDTAYKCAYALLTYYEKENFMPATFDSRWKSVDKYSCLTGDAQIVLNWLAIYKKTHDIRYLNGSKKLLDFIKSTVSLDKNDAHSYGAVAGAYPTYGGYSRWNFPNWATKFFVDACLNLTKDLK